MLSISFRTVCLDVQSGAGGRRRNRQAGDRWATTSEKCAPTSSFLPLNSSTPGRVGSEKFYRGEVRFGGNSVETTKNRDRMDVAFCFPFVM